MRWTCVAHVSYGCRMAPPVDLPFSGSKLRGLRHLRGLEQRELSDKTAQLGRCVPRERISLYENGRVVPSVAAFRALVEALECAPADLLDTDQVGAA